jgi:uncharacterized protein (DUF4415 family)
VVLIESVKTQVNKNSIISNIQGLAIIDSILPIAQEKIVLMSELKMFPVEGSIYSNRTEYPMRIPKALHKKMRIFVQNKMPMNFFVTQLVSDLVASRISFDVERLQEHRDNHERSTDEKIKITLRIDTDLYGFFRRKCDEFNMNVSEALINLIEQKVFYIDLDQD